MLISKTDSAKTYRQSLCPCVLTQHLRCLSVPQGSAGSLHPAGSDSVAHLHSRLRRPRRHHQLQVPADRGADPQATHPDVQEELPTQPQGTCLCRAENINVISQKNGFVF